MNAEKLTLPIWLLVFLVAAILGVSVWRIQREIALDTALTKQEADWVMQAAINAEALAKQTKASDAFLERLHPTDRPLVERLRKEERLKAALSRLTWLMENPRPSRNPR